MRKKYNLVARLILLLFVLNGLFGFGQSSNYLEFDGTDDYVKYTDDATLGLMDGASNYTMEAWIWIASDAADLSRIFQRYSLFYLYLNTNERLSFAVDNGGFHYYHSTNNVLTKEKWHHVAVIRDIAPSPNTFKIYVDGVDVTDGTKSGYQLNNEASRNLFIGNNGSDSRYFKGYIDEVRIKNVAEDIADLQLKITDSEYATDANTAALFHLDEGTGTTTVNVPSSTNASLTNSPTWRSWRYQSGHSLPLSDRYIWNGGTDTDWATTSNWDTEIAPSASDNVIIPNVANNPLIGTSTSANCNDITIESNAVLSIGGNLGVNGTLTNDAGNIGLVLKSTTSEQGSLIHTSANIDATVERQITGWSTDDDGWHLLSSPVDDMTISGTDFEPSTAPNTDDLFQWDESNNIWDYYDVGIGFTKFLNGHGYLCAYKTGATKDFVGTLNVANVTRSNMSADNGKWHLVGNPFASAISWNVGTWTKTAIGSNAKVYDEGAGNYFTKAIIPSTQGFFVEVTNASNTLIIPADARVHDGQDWYKESIEFENILELKLSGGTNSFYDLTKIVINDDATYEFDAEFDGHKLFGAATAPQLYTLSESNELLSDNNIPNSINEMLIPLNFRVATQSEYSIYVEQNNVVSEGNIYLEDLMTGVLTNLSTTNSYTFQASEQDNANRFLLHFNSTTGLENAEQTSNLNIYTNAHTIYLNSTESLSGDIMIYDMGGRLVFSNHLNNSNKHSISVETLSGIYLVHFIETNKVSTQKINIQ